MSSRCVRARQAGFTLIELLVVFAILGLLAALAPLAHEKIQRATEYRALVQTAMADLRHARNTAMASGVDARFEIDLANRRFGIEGGTMRSVPPTVGVKMIVAGQEVTPQQKGVIRFLPRGGSTGGTLEIVRANGVGVRLTVDWFSGRVTQQALAPV